MATAVILENDMVWARTLSPPFTGQRLDQISEGNMKLNVDLSGLEDCAGMMHMKAFDMGKNAASNGRDVESCPFEKDDDRYQQWADGHREWRCKDTLDLFETV